MSRFNRNLSKESFKKRKNEETKYYASVKQRPDAQNPANIKIPNINGMIISFFND